MLTNQDYAEALFMAFEESSPESYDTIIDNLILELTNAGRLESYPLIISVFEQILASKNYEEKLEPETQTLIQNKELLEKLNQGLDRKIHGVDEQNNTGFMFRIVESGETNVQE